MPHQRRFERSIRRVNRAAPTVRAPGSLLAAGRSVRAMLRDAALALFALIGCVHTVFVNRFGVSLLPFRASVLVHAGGISVMLEVSRWQYGSSYLHRVGVQRPL
jgi:hypothetical protein